MPVAEAQHTLSGSQAEPHLAACRDRIKASLMARTQNYRLKRMLYIPLRAISRTCKSAGRHSETQLNGKCGRFLPQRQCAATRGQPLKR